MSNGSKIDDTFDPRITRINANKNARDHLQGGPSLGLSYRGRVLLQTYQPDYICFEKIILEIKAVSELTDEHRAQLLNYLHAAGFQLGLLVNFGHYPKLEYQRFAKTQRMQSKTDPSDVCL